MKNQFLLLFNLFFLNICYSDIDAAASHTSEISRETETAQQLIFNLSYFTRKEMAIVKNLCINHKIPKPESSSGVTAKNPDTEKLCIKIYLGEEFIGFMILEEETEQDYQGGIYISHFVINTAHQRKGIGTACMEYMLSLFPEIDLFTLYSTEKGINFYKNFNFKIEREDQRDEWMVKRREKINDESSKKDNLKNGVLP